MRCVAQTGDSFNDEFYLHALARKRAKEAAAAAVKEAVPTAPKPVIPGAFESVASFEPLAWLGMHTTGYLSFWTYGSVCFACAQRPGLPRASPSRVRCGHKNHGMFLNGSTT